MKRLNMQNSQRNLEENILKAVGIISNLYFSKCFLELYEKKDGLIYVCKSCAK